MSVLELAASIKLYNEQLDQVSLSLQNQSHSPEETKQLEELQQDLLQLLELSLEQLEQRQKNASLQNTVNQPSPNDIEIKDDLDDEMALFKAEIEELETDKNKDSNESSTQSNSNDLSCNNVASNCISKSDYDSTERDTVLNIRELLEGNSETFVKTWSCNEVSLLEGEPVRAPYTEEWGGHTFHNALVMSVAYDENCSMATVLFSQPTSLSMLPCRFFLSGTCRFSVEDCQFSHGYDICVTDLKPYIKPCVKSLGEDSKVLCQHEIVPTSGYGKNRRKHSDSQNLWHIGTVEAVVYNKLSVNCSVCKEVVECSVDNVIPVNDLCTKKQLDDDTDEATLIDDANDTSRFSIEKEEEALKEDAVDDCKPSFILGGKSSVDFGDWEKHTKGIGSLLLQRMGYTPGKGLGKEGDGRVEPVPAYLYPAGVSLDRCMELRERSGGEAMVQVEKIMKREQLKEERRIKREEEALAKSSVFDIINNKLGGSSSKLSKENNVNVIEVGHEKLNSDSTKSLNFKSYQLSRQASQLEKDVNTLELSLQRQNKDKTTNTSIYDNLQLKKEELRNIRTAEQRVTSEQQTRKDTKKFVVF